MKTSRVARETARVVTSISKADYAPQRQTRSFAASLQTFTAHDSPLEIIEQSALKHESEGDDASSPHSSPSGHDIEDLPFSTLDSKKRKRGLGSPSTATTTISTSTSTRISPRNAARNENTSKVKKGRRQPARKTVTEDGEMRIEPPANWEEIYNAVTEMRKGRSAPVDTMGCETLADESLSPRDKRFQTLIALMLSSQTKDTTNAVAMRRLQTELPPPGLTIENILDVDPIKLNELIFIVGFHNNKTRYIKATALILRDQFNSDIPDTVEGLMSLPGVGPKMAYLCMSAAWGRTEGIGVDVHVHRITNLWGWHKTKGPEETREMLEAWLPRTKWHEINHLLVGFGQTVCLPVGRKCGACTLSQRGLCPSAAVERKTTLKTKRLKREAVDHDKVEPAVIKAEEESVVVKEEEVLAEEAVP